MRAQYVTPAEFAELLEPSATGWKVAKREMLKLIGTPLALQPTAAIQVAWAKRRIGAVDRVEVAVLHDGARLAFRLEWPDATENLEVNDTSAFSDAAAVLLDVKPGATLISMGAPGLPVDAWYWRADDANAFEVVAEGIGSTRMLEAAPVTARALWKGGSWQVVISRPLRVSSSESLAQLEPGRTTPFAVAVWEGSNGERAGIKAFSGEWRELVLDAVPTA